MKFTLQGPFRENIYNLMRKAGYSFQGRDEKKGELVFARPAREYPRFHLFLKISGEQFSAAQEMVLNLHLDQKKPIYEGAPAHAGEYQGEIVKKEAERIRQILKS